MFFVAGNFKNLLNLNDTVRSWLNLLSRCLIWAMFFGRVSIKIPRYLKLFTSLIGSAPENSYVWVSTYLLVKAMNSNFKGFNVNFLQLHQSSIFRNLLLTRSVNSSKFFPTYTSTVSYILVHTFIIRAHMCKITRIYIEKERACFWTLDNA